MTTCMSLMPLPNMMMKINFKTPHVKLYSTIIVLVVLACACGHKTTPPLQPAVYAVGCGFGYTISNNGKILIKQDAVPGVYGSAAFCDSLDAVKVSNLVVQKIGQKQSPSVTKQDLERLKIKTKC